MLGRDGCLVSEPRADDVQRVLLGQLGLPRAAKVLEEFWPRLEPSPPDDLHESRSQVCLVAVPRDDRLFAQPSRLWIEVFQQFIEHGLQVRPQLRERSAPTASRHLHGAPSSENGRGISLAPNRHRPRSSRNARSACAGPRSEPGRPSAAIRRQGRPPAPFSVSSRLTNCWRALFDFTLPPTPSNGFDVIKPLRTAARKNCEASVQRRRAVASDSPWPPAVSLGASFAGFARNSHKRNSSASPSGHVGQRLVGAEELDEVSLGVPVERCSSRFDIGTHS